MNLQHIADNAFKKKIIKRVYGLYLFGTSLQIIANLMNLTLKDVEEIIDSVNETRN